MKKRVLCPGEALIDFVAQDTLADLEKSEMFLKKAGGAPANAAAAMAKIGIEPYFLGSVGDDPFGVFLRETLIENDINLKYLQVVQEPTTLAFVSLNKAGERDFKFNRGADEKLKLVNLEEFKEFDCIHFASATAFLGGELEESYFNLLEYAKRNNILITFDANYREALFGKKKSTFIEKAKYFIAQANVVKLSDEEAILISGKEDIIGAGREIVKLGCDFLIISLGKDGSIIFTQDEEIKVGTVKVLMKDATGAGDAFIGSIVAQLMDKEEINTEVVKEVVEYASLIGALTTTKYGALESIPTKEEVRRYLENVEEEC